MTYLIFVAMFGTGTALFLWLRDARIFFGPAFLVTGKPRITVCCTARWLRWDTWLR
jgi:hypothetical protein